MTAPIEVTRALLASMPLPALGSDGDKDEHGRTLVLAGSEDVPGAAILTAEAALRAGAGKLQIGAPAVLAPAVGVAVPEARVLPLSGRELSDTVIEAIRQSDAVVLGPGWMDEELSGALAAGVLDATRGATLVIDAAAMTALADRPERVRAVGGPVILTPHAGEAAQLLGRSKEAVLADPVGAAKEAADRFDAVTVLKGATTHIAAPDGRIWRHVGGVAGLGVSGSGDVLAGLIGGFCARGAPAEAAALWGVALHAAAGEQLSVEVGPVGFLARELSARIPRLLAAWDA